MYNISEALQAEISTMVCWWALMGIAVVMHFSGMFDYWPSWMNCVGRD